MSDSTSTPEVVRYLTWQQSRGLAENTITLRASLLQRLTAFVAPLSLLEVTSTELENWLGSLVGVSKASSVTYARSVSAFYDWCVRTGLVRVNPAALMIGHRVPRSSPQPVDHMDLELAVAAAGPRVRVWLVLAAYAGLRSAEIAALRREDVLDTRTPPVLRVHGKGSKVRVVPLSEIVLKALADHGMPPAGPVFTRGDGSAVNAADVSRIGGRHLRSLNIDQRIDALRQHFATGVYVRAPDLVAVQELMGHKSPELTARYVVPDRVPAYDAVLDLGRLASATDCSFTA